MSPGTALVLGLFQVLACLFMNVPKPPGRTSGISENAWALLAGGREWVGASLGPLISAGKVLAGPAGNPSRHELASWEAAAIGLGHGAGQKAQCGPSAPLQRISLQSLITPYGVGMSRGTSRKSF